MRFFECSKNKGGKLKGGEVGRGGRGRWILVSMSEDLCLRGLLDEFVSGVPLVICRAEGEDGV